MPLPTLLKACKSLNANPLSEPLARLELTLPDDQIDLLQRYREQLTVWNERMNLTRHAEVEQFVTRDIWDSWQLAQLLSPQERVLDLGTGGGVPGIILAIIRPDLKVAVCESIGKKARAVESMVKELSLPVAVHAQRAQQLLPHTKFDTIVARAVGPLWKILSWVQPYWGRFDRLLLIKGPRWIEERGEARHRGYMQTLALRKAASYETPGHLGESVVLSIKADANDDQADYDGPYDGGKVTSS